MNKRKLTLSQADEIRNKYTNENIIYWKLA